MMRVGLYTDNTLSLPLEHLAKKLTELCHEIVFVKGVETFRVRETHISYPATYQSLPQGLQDALKTYDISILATTLPYDNNYFFEGPDNTIIVSFSDWNLLTDLPIFNGFVYFTLALLIRHLNLGTRHDENTACINDFWWDKRGVDLGMKVAYVCPTCLASAPSTLPELSDIKALLDILSRASRSDKDIMDFLPLSKEPGEEDFDIFLCHNSEDKPAIIKIDEALVTGGLRTWLDKVQLPLGLPWPRELEKQIGKIPNAAVFVGENGLGPWEKMEIYALLNEFVNRGCPVIPVILPTATSIPELPLFLKMMTWLDLRKDYTQGLIRMIEEIKQARPL